MIHTPPSMLRRRRRREASPRFSRRTAQISRFRPRKTANCVWSTPDGTTRTLGHTASRRAKGRGCRPPPGLPDSAVTRNGPPLLRVTHPPGTPLRPRWETPSTVQIFHHEIRPGDPFQAAPVSSRGQSRRARPDRAHASRSSRSILSKTKEKTSQPSSMACVPLAMSQAKTWTSTTATPRATRRS